MKGTKGGNRERIISWLFSERTRKIREEKKEVEQDEEIKDEGEKKQKKENVKNSDVVIEIEQDSNIDDKPIEDNCSNTTIVVPIDEKVENTEKTKHNDNIENIENEEIDDDYPNQKNKCENEIKETPSPIVNEASPTHHSEQIITSPTLFIDEKIVTEIKEQNRKQSKEITQDIAEEIKTANNFFPEVEEVILSEEELLTSFIEKPELIQISIIEEIDELLRNDNYELNDIKYRIEVLNEQEKDEVLLENIEKIKKELEELIKRFNELKKKYDYAYSTVSIKDITLINASELGNTISDYVVKGKNDEDNSHTLDQIYEIEEFISIINGIIEIEKEKDIVEESVDNKLIDFSIRDKEFIKLQDQYADIESINSLIDNYNREMDSIFADIDDKVSNSLDINRRIETSIRIVPDINRMISATVLLASTKMIPPTPMGNLFRTSLFITATHMMATAFTSQIEEREIITTTIKDYSVNILDNKDTMKDILGNIENAFSEINYVKDTFDKNLSQYRNQIPEYDTFVKNIFSIEKELLRQQSIAYDYSAKFDNVLKENNQKVKVLENE